MLWVTATTQQILPGRRGHVPHQGSSCPSGVPSSSDTSFGHAQHPQEMLGCSNQASRFSMIGIVGWVMELV